MATSDAQKRAAAKWQSQNIDRLSIVVPRGQRETIKAAAAAAGESVNAYIIGAINARMAGAPATAPKNPAHPDPHDLPCSRKKPEQPAKLERR